MVTETIRQVIYLGHYELASGKLGQGFLPKEHLSDDVHKMERSKWVFGVLKGRYLVIGGEYELPITEKEDGGIQATFSKLNFLGASAMDTATQCYFEMRDRGLKLRRKSQAEEKKLAANPRVMQEVKHLKAMRDLARYSDDREAFDLALMSMLRR